MTKPKTSHQTDKKTSQKTKPKTLVLLDAHAILHRAYHALPDFSSPQGEPTGALYGVVAILLKLIEEHRPDYIAAAFDLPEPTHRHLAYDAYKATRQKTDEALITQINRSRDIFTAFNIPIYEQPGFEADDVLGTIVTETKANKDLHIIIASGDMDTLQLVSGKKVQVYTPRRGVKDTVMYDEAAVKTRFGFGPALMADYKGLRGDPSDNIPGIAGIGEKTATLLITKFGTIEKIYAAIDKKNGADKLLEAGIKPRIIELLKANQEEAIFSKMLATIRCDVPIKFSLPKQSWTDTLDLETILALCKELNFKTLAERSRVFFGGEAEPEKAEPDKPPDAELTETAVALWLLEPDTTNPTLDDILAYAERKGGAVNFASARKLIFDCLKTEGTESVFKNIEQPLIPILQTMHETGILLDSAYLKKSAKKLHRELAELEKDIYQLAGTEFNINSPKQLGEVLYDGLGLSPKRQKRTATGQRSTNEAELQKMVDDSPIIPKLLRYRELNKLLTTYIDNLPTMTKADGRLHTTLLQTGTVTGRLASRDPNLQNIPIRTEEGRAVRAAFVPEPGFKLVAIDYSQVELRIAAILSGDEKLIEIFKQGEDVHQAVAAAVFGIEETAVTDELRRHAKVINFGILYGMGVNALRGNLGEGTTVAEAKAFLQAYFHIYTRLAEYLEETKSLAREQGYTTTMFGRRRYFLGLKQAAPFIRARAERMAINAPIQGTSADMIKLAMVNIDRYLKQEKKTNHARMLLQVHDELLFEVAEKQVDDIVPTLISLMEEVLETKDSQGVPILASAKIGDNWQDLKEYQPKAKTKT